VFVLEEYPPSDRARWYCHGSGIADRSFDSVDEAVAWGLDQARSVVVRTFDSVFYGAGERPANWA
jgi:hypothetical protein